MTRSGAPRALVVGGGVAGLAAAFGLHDRGYRVTLFESRQQLGGRAFSFEDRKTGQVFDNGPHVMLGCYRAMRGLLDRIGAAGDFEHQPTLRVAYRALGEPPSALRLPALPVPLAMPLALMRLPLTVGERWRALLGLGAVLRRSPAPWSVADWLRRRGQLGAPADWLWTPLCRAIMNVEPELAAARLFTSTLREAFSGRARSGAFLIPKRPWGAVLGEPAARQLAAEGIELRRGSRLVDLVVVDGAVRELRFGAGPSEVLEPTDTVVSALPWHALHRLVGGTQAFGALRKSPIVSAYFSCASSEEAIPDEGPITSLVAGDPFHFVCRTPGAGRQHFALLAGGATSLAGHKVEAIEEIARQQLARHYPGFDARVAAHVRIAKEAGATIVPESGSDALRPPPGLLEGGPRNLLVCGDWTDCGLPSTLEGAARSAEQMLRGFDRA